MLPYGITVMIYTGKGFQGESAEIDGPWFVDDTYEHTCVNLNDYLPLEEGEVSVGSIEVT